MFLKIDLLEKIKINFIFVYIVFLSIYAPVTEFFSETRFIFSGFAFLVGLISLFFLKNKKIILILPIFIFYFLISVNNFGLSRALYGWYIYAFFIFSFTLNRQSIVIFFDKKIIFWTTVLLINIIAVLYVDKNGSPWLGASTESFGVERVVSKDWTAAGIMRNPGFTSNSVTVACLLILSYIMSYISIAKTSNLFAKVYFIFLLPLIAYSIYLTTTKTEILCLFFVVVLMLFKDKYVEFVSKILILIMIITSYVFLFSPIKEYWGNNTLLIRFFQMWPSAFQLLDNNLSLLIGKGFGSIGSAQNFDNPTVISNPGDNLLVYLYVSFGVFSIFFILYFIFNLFRFKYDINFVKKKYFYIILMILVFNSFTYNLIELSVFAILFGIFVKVFMNLRFKN